LECDEPVGVWIRRINFETDAFLHVVYDSKVLNREALQHHDLAALCNTPSFVTRCIARVCEAGSDTKEMDHKSPSSKFGLWQLMTEGRAERYPLMRTLIEFNNPFFVRDSLGACGYGLHPEERSYEAATETQKKMWAEVFQKALSEKQTGKTDTTTVAIKDMDPKELWVGLQTEAKVCPHHLSSMSDLLNDVIIKRD